MCQSHVQEGTAEWAWGGGEGGEGEPRADCKIVLYCTAIKINVTRNEFPTLYENARELEFILM